MAVSGDPLGEWWFDTLTEGEATIERMIDIVQMILNYLPLKMTIGGTVLWWTIYMPIIKMDRWWQWSMQVISLCSEHLTTLLMVPLYMFLIQSKASSSSIWLSSNRVEEYNSIIFSFCWLFDSCGQYWSIHNGKQLIDTILLWRNI